MSSLASKQKHLAASADAAAETMADAAQDHEAQAELVRVVEEHENSADPGELEQMHEQQRLRRVEVDPCLLETAVFAKLDTGSEADGEADESQAVAAHQEGTVSFFDGTTYTGAFRRGQIHGFGALTWQDGCKYEGDFQANTAHGHGRISWPDGSSYEGSFVDGLREGKGTFVSACGTISYEGDWKASKREGTGTLRQARDAFRGEAVYEGEWLAGLRAGQGRMVYSSGDVYDGAWAADKPCGFGRMEWYRCNERYVGEWRQGMRHGQGQHAWLEVDPTASEPLSPKSPTETQPRKIMCNHYEGSWADDQRSGQGTFFYADGSRYKGEWKDNMKHGQGVYTYTDGRVYQGAFDRDRMLGPEPMSETHSAKAFGSLGIELEIMDLIPGIGPKCRRVQREVENVLLRWNASLRNTYMSCSHLEDPCVRRVARPAEAAAGGHVFAMRLWQFWVYCRACQIVDEHVTLAKIDRILRDVRQAHGSSYGADRELRPNPIEDIHDRYIPVLFREFVEALVRIAYAKFAPNDAEDGLSVLVARLLNKHASLFDMTLESDLLEIVATCAASPVSTDALEAVYNGMAQRAEGQANDRVVTVRGFVTALKRASIVATSREVGLEVGPWIPATEEEEEPAGGQSARIAEGETEDGEGNKDAEAAAATEEKIASSRSGQSRGEGEEEAEPADNEREEEIEPLKLHLSLQEALMLVLGRPVSEASFAAPTPRSIEGGDGHDTNQESVEEEKSNEVTQQSARSSARSAGQTKAGAAPEDSAQRSARAGGDEEDRSVGEADDTAILLAPAPPPRTTADDMSRELIFCEVDGVFTRVVETLEAKLRARGEKVPEESYASEFSHYLRAQVLDAICASCL